MAKRVTMQQIADYLGVSKYVVSKALSGKVGVNETTRKNVFMVASKLGYFSNKDKKMSQIKLNTTKTSSECEKKQTVLVIMPNVRSQTKESSYWGRILDGLTDALDKVGIRKIVITETNVETLANVINPKGIVGAVTVGLVSTSLLLEVHKMKVPVVMIDHEDPLLYCDSLFNNNHDCSHQITNHLVGLGHRLIQFVGDIQYSRSFYDRWLGFRSALEANNISYTIDSTLTTISMDATKLVKEFSDWMKSRPVEELPTAFVCANDLIAERIIFSLKENGYNVPDDFSVTGFDNKEITYQTVPTITTVDIPKVDLGKRAVEMLLRRISEKDAPFEKVLLTGTVMLRESTKGI